MAQAQMTSEERDALEQLIDRCGLRQVLDNVAGICHDKAEHIQGNWATRTGKQCDDAVLWTKAAKPVERAVVARAVCIVSHEAYDAMASTSGPHPAYPKAE